MKQSRVYNHPFTSSSSSGGLAAVLEGHREVEHQLAVGGVLVYHEEPHSLELEVLLWGRAVLEYGIIHL
jgi:hypothetical protein